MLNIHIDHIEDLIFLNEGKYLFYPYDVFKSLFHSIKNKKLNNDLTLSLKIDGSPAFTCFSSFNEIKQCGVSTKSMLNKIPKIFYDEYDIECEFDDKYEDLIYKLKYLLKFIKELNIPKNEIWQGDFLFDDKGLKLEKINDKEYIIFQPNIIIYAIEKQKFFNKFIGKKLGIVFHTKYTGNLFNDLKISFDIDYDIIKHWDILSINPTIKTFNNVFSENEQNYINYFLESLYESLYFLNNNENYKFIVNDKKLIKFISLYQNYIIKEDIKEFIIENFCEFINEKYKKEIYSKKKGKNKNKLLNELTELLNLINLNKDILNFIIKTINNIVKLKEIYLKKLNENVDIFETFIKLKEGNYTRTDHEGFVATLNNKLVKLVNRREFSKLNFSNEIIRGWKS